MSELQEKLLEIKRQKDTYILPENIKKDITVYGVTGTYEGSGGTVSVEEKDVNFYDYDGTRLYSYTLTEVQNLTELPALPSHTGLTCQGWNWTLADIKAEEKETDVGAIYITDDGKTRLYIRISAEGRMTVPLCFRQSIANGVEVDWGDGSAVETFAGSDSTNILPTHTYKKIGHYVITLNPLNNCVISLGGNSNSFCVMGSTNNVNKVYLNMLYKVEIGNNVTNIDNYAFAYCFALSIITIPNNITKICEGAFYYCYNLSNIIMPSKLSSLEKATLSGCYTISRIILSHDITNLGNNAITNCYCLLRITLPSCITKVENYGLAGNYSLSSIVIPNKLSKINSMSFGSCYGVAYYDFSLFSTIPTLMSTTAFQNIASDCKIIVPDDLYDDWISASNWSTYASYIIKKSDWEASQV